MPANSPKPFPYRMLPLIIALAIAALAVPVTAMPDPADSPSQAAIAATLPIPDSLRTHDKSLGREPLPVAPKGYYIRIDKSSHSLALYLDGKLVKDYLCTVGEGSGDKRKADVEHQTPEGNFYIDKITASHAWEYPYPSGPEKAYGPWFLRLATGRGETFSGKSWTGIGIHGTSRPQELGQHSSHGCVRLSNADIAELKENLEGQFRSGPRIPVVIVP